LHGESLEGFKKNFREKGQADPSMGRL